MTEQHPTQGRVVAGVSGAEGPSTAASSTLSSATPELRDIPQATVTRLAAYLRVLALLVDEGTHIVSSEELAAASGVGSAKLRKDLSFLGPNGVRGVGYDVSRLRGRIEQTLGLDRGHKVVLVGVGNLGQALAGYGGFERRGFEVVGLFDVDPDVIGTRLGSLDVRHIDDLDPTCRELEATIGVIATPDDAAQTVCDQLVAAGLDCILSFSAAALVVPEHVEMRRVDLAVEMQVLSFNSARKTGQVLPRVRIGHATPVPSAAKRNGSVIAP